jgi:hypothetical protein
VFSPHPTPKHCITWQPNPTNPAIYELELNDINSFKQHYDELECHLVVYPYSRAISANDFHLQPYEEYVKDIASNRKSAYSKVGDQSNKTFGILFGSVIIAIVALLKPSDFFSVEALVSIFAGYVLGKDLWNDVERLLVNISKKWRLRFQELYYLYELDPHTTLTNYSYLAKWRRYGKRQILPDKMDMIEHSNSQTIRLSFNLQRWKDLQDQSLHLFSIHVSEQIAAQFSTDKMMLGLKLSFNKKKWGYTKCLELFQSADGEQMGCLDDKGNWHNQHIFYRHTRRIYRWKWLVKSGLLPAANQDLIVIGKP